ncbi:MAG: hypothetical protein ACLRL4_07035 [Bifidobacterium bifidum]
MGETFRLALAALRSTVGDAKFREIEKTWVQEHQEQFDPTGLKITATYSDKSTKAIDPSRAACPTRRPRPAPASAPIIALAALAPLTGGAAVAKKRHSEPEPQHRR